MKRRVYVEAPARCFITSVHFLSVGSADQKGWSVRERRLHNEEIQIFGLKTVNQDGHRPIEF